MPECHGRGEKTVDFRVTLLSGFVRLGLVGIEHLQVTHAEIAAEIVHFAKVEIDEPRVFGGTITLVLAVITVGQPHVKGMVVTF